MPDAPSKVQRPQQRKLAQRPQVRFQREDATLKEEDVSEDDSSDEEETPQLDVHQKTGHHAACYQHKRGDPVWILYVQPQQSSTGSGPNVHVPMDSDMAGYNPGRGP